MHKNEKGKKKKKRRREREGYSTRTQTTKQFQKRIVGKKKWQQQESRHKSRVRSLGSRSVDASTLIRSRLFFYPLLSLTPDFISNNISCFVCVCVLLKKEKREPNNCQVPIDPWHPTDLCAPLNLLLTRDLCVFAPWWDYLCSDYYYPFASPMPLYGYRDNTRKRIEISRNFEDFLIERQIWINKKKRRPSYFPFFVGG